jgi:Nucleotidyl transferase AbiEii toxin, Type IV TA system
MLSELSSDFVLYGGTALSLQVGGRISVDFDFFTNHPIDQEKLTRHFSFLRESRLLQRAENTATFLTGAGNDGVLVSFFGGFNVGRVGEPIRFADNGLYAAALIDLAAQKVKVRQQRAEAKDYLDIHTLLNVGITLEMALGAARALYPEFNAAISLKALCYYKDVPRVPPEIQRDLAIAASRVRDIAHMSKRSGSLLPEFGPITRSSGLDELLPPKRESRTKEHEREL